jgi:hypothetical protein
MTICSRCKYSAPRNEFILKNGAQLKMCSRCRQYGRKQYTKVKTDITQLNKTIDTISQPVKELIPEPIPEPIQKIELQYVIHEVPSGKHKFHECHRCGTDYIRADFHKRQPAWRQYWCGWCIENHEDDTQCPKCHKYSILSDDYPYCEHCSFNPKTKTFEKEAKIII